MREAKPFLISRQEVYDAYRIVKANKGAAGVDKQTITEFEEDLKNNLYKIWNRMSSGSYFPPPVMRVEIPKSNGKTRPLGIPTVADRIAQTVIKRRLEPTLEAIFHPDSYGYRPGRSPLQAVGVARERCWKYDWVVDLDIKSFFETIDHKLIMKAVRKHTDCKWVLLYIERWLKAPVQLKDGTLLQRTEGTPQGGVISPLLANLFLHYAIDKWLQEKCPNILFERFADDIICHCKTKAQALWLMGALEKRLKQCGLELNLQKTKIVYCQDGKRKGTYPNKSFDFLGFTFQARKCKSAQGVYFTGFNPGMSKKAMKEKRQELKDLEVARRTQATLEDLAETLNEKIRGWIQYYGKFYKTAMYPLLNYVNGLLVEWARSKYKRFKRGKKKARNWLETIEYEKPKMFAHWYLLKEMV